MRLQPAERGYINDITRLVGMQPEHKKLMNCIRFPYKTTRSHDEKMAHICTVLKHNPEGHKIIFWTEAVIVGKNGEEVRPDIFFINLDLSHYGAIEVLETEEDCNILKKREKYPCPIYAHRDGAFDYKSIC